MAWVKPVYNRDHANSGCGHPVCHHAQDFVGVGDGHGLDRDFSHLLLRVGPGGEDCRPRQDSDEATPLVEHGKEALTTLG